MTAQTQALADGAVAAQVLPATAGAMRGNIMSQNVTGAGSKAAQVKGSGNTTMVS